MTRVHTDPRPEKQPLPAPTTRRPPGTSGAGYRLCRLVVRAESHHAMRDKDRLLTGRGPARTGGWGGRPWSSIRGEAEAVVRCRPEPGEALTVGWGLCLCLWGGWGGGQRRV